MFAGFLGQTALVGGKRCSVEEAVPWQSEQNARRHRLPGVPSFFALFAKKGGLTAWRLPDRARSLARYAETSSSPLR